MPDSQKAQSTGLLTIQSESVKKEDFCNEKFLELSKDQLLPSHLNLLHWCPRLSKQLSHHKSAVKLCWSWIASKGPHFHPFLRYTEWGEVWEWVWLFSCLDSTNIYWTLDFFTAEPMGKEYPLIAIYQKPKVALGSYVHWLEYLLFWTCILRDVYFNKWFLHLKKKDFK